MLGGYDIFKETIIRAFWSREPESKWRPLLLNKLYPTLPGAGPRAKFYLQEFGELNCHLGCRECASACPHSVPVSTIMRYHYYFDNKGREKYAMKRYQELQGKQADICLSCPGYCEDACPHDVLVRPMLTIAHDNLNHLVT
jgi:ferredoxin